MQPSELATNDPYHRPNPFAHSARPPRQVTATSLLDIPQPDYLEQKPASSFQVVGHFI